MLLLFFPFSLSFEPEYKNLYKLASWVDAIAISKIWNYDPLSRFQKIISQKQDPSRVRGEQFLPDFEHIWRQIFSKLELGPISCFALWRRKWCFSDCADNHVSRALTFFGAGTDRPFLGPGSEPDREEIELDRRNFLPQSYV